MPMGHHRTSTAAVLSVCPHFHPSLKARQSAFIGNTENFIFSDVPLSRSFSPPVSIRRKQREIVLIWRDVLKQPEHFRDALRCGAELSAVLREESLHPHRATALVLSLQSADESRCSTNSSLQVCVRTSLFIFLHKYITMHPRWWKAENKAMPVLQALRMGPRTPFLHGLTFSNQQSASMTNNCLQLSLAKNEANLHMLNLNEEVLAWSPTRCYQTTAACAKKRPKPTCTHTHTQTDRQTRGWKEPAKGESKGLRGSSVGRPPALCPAGAEANQS